jgi:hypothetical protein
MEILNLIRDIFDRCASDISRLKVVYVLHVRGAIQCGEIFSGANM